MDDDGVMIQKLSVISMLVLVLLAGVGSIVVATHAFGGRAPNSIGGASVLLSPVGAANVDAGNGGNVGGVSGTTIHATSTVTVTSTVSAPSSVSVSTSVSTTAQSSTSSAGGSLLVSGPSGSNSTSHDDGGSDDGMAGGSGSGGSGGDD